jgi:hypothetical protein
LKKKVWCVIIVLILLSGIFTTAVATYPEGALAALSNPLDAINQLFAKIAELERRIGIIEKLLGIGGENKTGERMEYPYAVSIESNLTGKIEAKYNWQKIYSQEWNENKGEYGLKILTEVKWCVFIKNLSNQTIRKIYYDIFIKDENGNVILDGGSIIVSEETGMTPTGETYKNTYTLRETPLYTKVPPGGTTSFEAEAWIKDALENHKIDPTSDPVLIVEILITSIEFG